MPFPTMSAIDAATFPKMADADESQCVYKSRAGVSTSLAAIITDVDLERYDENGAVITITRREAEILRADIDEPEEGATLTYKSVKYRLLQMVRRDDGSTVWVIARPST